LLVETNVPLAADIIGSLRSNAFNKNAPPAFSALGDTVVGKPRFGSVYFGPLPCFAFGKPHFAMVQSRVDEDFWGHSVAMSPITTKQQDVGSLDKCLEIPPGILPVSYRHGVKEQIASWVLLPIILRVPVNYLRDKLRYEVHLPSTLLSEAEAKLRRMG